MELLTGIPLSVQVPVKPGESLERSILNGFNKLDPKFTHQTCCVPHMSFWYNLVLPVFMVSFWVKNL